MSTRQTSPFLNSPESGDEPTSSLSLGPQRSPFNTTPLSLSLNAVGQHFLDMTLSSDGHAPTLSPIDDVPFVPTSSSKPIRPRRPSASQLDSPLNISRFHSCDDVRPGLSPPITPRFPSGSRLTTPRSMSSPLLPRRRSEPDQPVNATVTVTIPLKASETLGAINRDETFQDERPMTPLRAGAKALRLLGGLEDAAMIGKKGKVEKRRKEYGLIGWVVVSGRVDIRLDNLCADHVLVVCAVVCHRANSNDNESMFQMASLMGKSRRVTPGPIIEPAQIDRESVLQANEKVIGVLPMPRKVYPSALSRCPSPDTQSERSFDHYEGRQSSESLLDDVVVVGHHENRSSGEHDRDRYQVARTVNNVPRKRIASSDMAFLTSDPYARTRGPSPAVPTTNQPKRRPPPLALTLSNGKTTSMPDRIPQTRLAPDQIRQNDMISRPPARISSLPYTPFTRPRVAPAPPQVGRSSSDSMVRPLLDKDLPVDVSVASEPNEPIPIPQDPHRKGRSFFIEDESPTQGSFGMPLAKKITLKGMGESWKRAVANRI